MDIDLTAFSQNLKKFRKEKGFNQQDFANHLRIGQNNISRYERGDVVPKLEIAVAISKALDVFLDVLCGLNKSEPSKLELLAKKPAYLPEDVING